MRTFRSVSATGRWVQDTRDTSVGGDQSPGDKSKGTTQDASDGTNGNAPNGTTNIQV